MRCHYRLTAGHKVCSTATTKGYHVTHVLIQFSLNFWLKKKTRKRRPKIMSFTEISLQDQTSIRLVLRKNSPANQFGLSRLFLLPLPWDVFFFFSPSSIVFFSFPSFPSLCWCPLYILDEEEKRSSIPCRIVYSSLGQLSLFLGEKWPERETFDVKNC